MLLHALEVLDNDLGGRADDHLAAATALGVGDVDEGVVEGRDHNHLDESLTIERDIIETKSIRGKHMTTHNETTEKPNEETASQTAGATRCTQRRKMNRTRTRGQKR